MNNKMKKKRMGKHLQFGLKSKYIAIMVWDSTKVV